MSIPRAIPLAMIAVTFWAVPLLSLPDSGADRQCLRFWFGDGRRLPVLTKPPSEESEQPVRESDAEWFRLWFGDGRRLPSPL